MSKHDKKVVYNLNDYKAKKAEEGAIVIEGEDRTFTVPPPVLWPDEVIEFVERDPVRAARALLGDDYAEFVEAGGSATVLLSIVNDEHGVSVPES